ncbi:hypothetical protein ACF0H5_010352 [Mactra antiquata]
MEDVNVAVPMAGKALGVIQHAQRDGMEISATITAVYIANMDYVATLMEYVNMAVLMAGRVICVIQNAQRGCMEISATITAVYIANMDYVATLMEAVNMAVMMAGRVICVIQVSKILITDWECQDGSYGPECAHVCSANCLGEKYINCSNVDGKCEQGCQPGWVGDRCDQKCSEGKYGNQCNNDCSINCKNRSCNHIDGRCEHGCHDGWKGDICQEECSDGFYGVDCLETCGECKNGLPCNTVNGECPQACFSGFGGDICLSDAVETFSLKKSLIYVYIGSGGFVLISISFSFVIAFVQLRKRRGRASIGNIELADTTSSEEIGPERTISIGLVEAEIDKTRTRVKLSDLLQYVKLNLSNIEKLVAEFQTLPNNLQYPAEAALVDKKKNRYKGILPYDKSRVVLSTIENKQNSDYINATYIQGHHQENAYIATQGPVTETVDDFWRMIWEKDIEMIVMLTNLVEGAKVKCVEYWGEQNTTVTHGDISVYTEPENVYAEVTVRTFKVYHKNDNEHQRIVTQLHYRLWPDKGVPNEAFGLVQFLHTVREIDPNKAHAWLVHCSAGVGRTGTFIAMDILYDEGNDLGSIDIYSCVQKLRDQRVNMVQTKEQYILLHASTVEMLVFSSKPIYSELFESYYEQLQGIDDVSGKSNLLLQYEGFQDKAVFMKLLYDSLRVVDDDKNVDQYYIAKLDENKDKNRYQNILPANEFRPFLTTNIPGCTSYINAVYIPSGTSKRGNLLTQIPMKTTAIDCCRLLIEENVKVVVTFDYKWKENEDIGIYLSENDKLRLGPFTSKMMDENVEQNYIRRTHRIKYKSEKRIVHQFVFKGWPRRCIVPQDIVSVIDILQQIDIYNRKEDGQTIIFQCLNGSDRSGLFVVLMNIIESVKNDGMVSIPQIICQAKLRRESIIPCFEQFKFCYDVLLGYIRSSNAYVNV